LGSILRELVPATVVMWNVGRQSHSSRLKRDGLLALDVEEIGIAVDVGTDLFVRASIRFPVRRSPVTSSTQCSGFSALDLRHGSHLGVWSVRHDVPARTAMPPEPQESQYRSTNRQRADRSDSEPPQINFELRLTHRAMSPLATSRTALRGDFFCLPFSGGRQPPAGFRARMLLKGL